MLFNSVDFVLFLPIVIVLYYLLPSRWRWILLLAASYYFYMCWEVSYIFLILISTLIDYGCGLAMEASQKKRVRRSLLILSLTSNLGLLFFFKYFGFFSENLQLAFDEFNIAADMPVFDFLLPVGISFYTFQTLSYSIDVYKGRLKAERHLGYFALYVAYFPQLVAGPIERYNRLAPQLRAKVGLQYDHIANGLRLILYGLFVKMVVADNISFFVDHVYQLPEKYSSLQVGLAMVLYSVQIYCDFHGYSTVAIGSARLMGVELMDNFRTPYLSKSIGEFWQRWHISLSTWFRDYVYVPLGGNRVGFWRWILNIMVVFLVSGLWHGANWTFVVWGGLYGLVYIIERFFNRWLGVERYTKPFSVAHLLLSLKTFVIVTLIWVFFRSDSLADAWNIFGSLLENGEGGGGILSLTMTVWGLLAVFLLSEFLLYDTRFDTWVGKRPFLVRWGVYAFLMFAVLALSGTESYPFIYFQF